MLKIWIIAALLALVAAPAASGYPLIGCSDDDTHYENGEGTHVVNRERDCQEVSIEDGNVCLFREETTTYESTQGPDGKWSTDKSESSSDAGCTTTHLM